MDYVIGVDLGGTFLRTILADRAGKIYAQMRVATEVAQGPQAVIERMIACIDQVRVAVPAGGHLLGVGVGSPGPLDPWSGIIFAAPNMPGWFNIPLRDTIAKRTSLPVELDNDANVAALGEWTFGGGKGHQHLVYITVSTGIGAGVITDGRLMLGRLGAATELGQMIIDSDQCQTWEQLASGTALAAAASAAMAANGSTLLHKVATPQTVSAADVSWAAQEGDALAQHLMEREARLLGIGFANVLHAFSPEIILVGGGVVLANPTLLRDAHQFVHTHVVADLYRAVPIELAHLGEQAGVLGAAALVFYRYDHHERVL